MTTIKCACGENDARYINERGELCCGLCPIKEGIDSIRIVDVPRLLGWSRIVISYLKTQIGCVVPASDLIQEVLGRLPGRSRR